MVLHHSKRFPGLKSLIKAKQGRKSTYQWGSYETKVEYFFPHEDITFAAFSSFTYPVDILICCHIWSTFC